MKKHIAIILMLVFCMALAGCADNETAETNVPATQIEVLPTLAVDMDATGIVANEPAPIDSGKITIGDKEYVFPMLVSELVDDGWYFDENARERLAEMDLVEAKSTRTIDDFNLFHDEYADGFRLMILGVYNDGDEPAQIRDCYLGAISVNATMVTSPEKLNLVLPGGVTWKSTAADVVSIYGNAENHPYFYFAKLEGSSADYTGEHFNVSFTFDDDGKINYLQYNKYVDFE